MTSISQEIEFLIGDNKVVLFMKGSRDFPQCGFSAAVCHILGTLEVDFMDVDVLKSPELRQGIKDFSDWPTVPQLYVDGEFVGGCDIIKEMYESGELKELFEVQTVAI
ncbi:MAG: monothiol glutaredoxin [Rickettsiales bacterium]|jgi:monothiol glutaredoxin